MARKPVSTLELTAQPLWTAKRSLAKALRAKNRKALTSGFEALLRTVLSDEHPAVKRSAEKAFRDYFAECSKAGITQLAVTLR